MGSEEDIRNLAQKEWQDDEFHSGEAPRVFENGYYQGFIKALKKELPKNTETGLQFITRKQDEHFKEHGCYADVNRKIGEWCEEYAKHINSNTTIASREKITKILYENSHDDSECLRIKFENINTIIELILKEYGNQ